MEMMSDKTSHKRPGGTFFGEFLGRNGLGLAIRDKINMSSGGDVQEGCREYFVMIGMVDPIDWLVGRWGMAEKRQRGEKRRGRSQQQQRMNEMRRSDQR